MNIKKFLPAIIAVVLGLAAAFLVRNSMMKVKPVAVVQAPKFVPAVIATGNLMAGQVIAADNLTTTTVEAPTLPQDMDIVGNSSDVVGRVLKEPIVKGETIHMKNIEPRGAMATLPSLVPAGMRAVTLNVDETNSFSGMLLPGCHIDVLTTLGSGKDSFSRTLVSNVLVQAVGQRLTSAKPEDGKEPPAFHTVTLIVDPRQAQLIDLAAGSSRFRFALRPLAHGQDENDEDVRTTVADLVGLTERSAVAPTPVAAPIAPSPTTQPSPAPAVANAAPAHRNITLILGANVTQVPIQMADPVQTTQVDTTSDQKLVIEGSEPPQE